MLKTSRIYCEVIFAKPPPTFSGTRTIIKSQHQHLPTTRNTQNAKHQANNAQRAMTALQRAVIAGKPHAPTPALLAAADHQRRGASRTTTETRFGARDVDGRRRRRVGLASERGRRGSARGRRRRDDPGGNGAALSTAASHRTIRISPRGGAEDQGTASRYQGGGWMGGLEWHRSDETKGPRGRGRAARALG